MKTYIRIDHSRCVSGSLWVIGLDFDVEDLAVKVKEESAADAIKFEVAADGTEVGLDFEGWAKS